MQTSTPLVPAQRRHHSLDGTGVASAGHILHVIQSEASQQGKRRSCTAAPPACPRIAATTVSASFASYTALRPSLSMPKSMPLDTDWWLVRERSSGLGF